MELVKVEDGWELHIVIKVKTWPDILSEIKQFRKLFNIEGQEN